MFVIEKGYISGFYSDSGNVEDTNEDSLGIIEGENKYGGFLFASLCDGMGGYQSGEIASGYIVEQSMDWFYQKVIPILDKHSNAKKALKRCIKTGNKLLLKLNFDLLNYQRIHQKTLGSTVINLIIYKQFLLYFHVGDSRLYQISKKIRIITIDQKVEKHILTNCIGVNRMLAIEKKIVKTDRLSKFLICSDGFYNGLNQRMLEAIFLNNSISSEEIHKMLNEIGVRNKRKGERDNLSAILIQRSNC